MSNDEQRPSTNPRMDEVTLVNDLEMALLNYAPDKRVLLLIGDEFYELKQVTDDETDGCVLLEVGDRINE